MCLIVLAIGQHRNYPLIVLANRDEYFARPTQLASFWPDFPWIFGGRDLLGGGSWLAATRTGKLAMVTNYRSPAASQQNVLSRGQLVKDYLVQDQGPLNYLQQLDENYPGFNLILGDHLSFYYFSNQTKRIVKLSDGLFGLSNHLLDTPWPKVDRVKALLDDYLTISIAKPSLQVETLFDILSDEAKPEDTLLPNTGLPIEQERALSSIFINNGNYGTRCSTVLLLNNQQQLAFYERTFSLATTKVYAQHQTVIQWARSNEAQGYG